jgi:hypothetical protein
MNIILYIYIFYRIYSVYVPRFEYRANLVPFYQIKNGLNAVTLPTCLV